METPPYPWYILSKLSTRGRTRDFDAVEGPSHTGFAVLHRRFAFFLHYTSFEKHVVCFFYRIAMDYAIDRRS